MAFASAVTAYGVEGDMAVSRGTYTSSASGTGGDIDTGLAHCEHIKLTPKAAAVSASAPVVNETLPVAGNAVTIVTIADEVGYWKAMGTE